MSKLKITAKAFLIACFAQVAVMTPLQVHAEDNIGAALINFMGGIIVQGMKQDAQKNSAQKSRSTVSSKKRAYAKRVQTALKTLGFYTKGIDGVWGRGSQGALDAYRAAFDLPTVSFASFSEEELIKLEAYASQGWRSQEEISRSREGGFISREEYLAASDSGFEEKSEWTEAQTIGLESKETFDVFKLSGFTSPENFQLANVGGFTSEADFDEAQESGFRDAEEFIEFKDSGHDTKAGFDKANKIREEGDKAAVQCDAASQKQEWFAADAACAVATKALPDDLDMKLFADTARKAVEFEQFNVEQELVAAEGLVVNLLNQYEGSNDRVYKNKLDTARANVKNLMIKSVFSKLHLDETACSVAVKLSDWERANEICGEANVRASGYLATDASSVELIESLRQYAILAQVELKAENDRAVVEREKLSLKSAKKRGQELLDEVTAYSASGNQFSNGIPVARKMVTLRQSLKLEDSVEIEKAYSDLSSLIVVDSVFIADRAARKEAEEISMIESSVAAKKGVGYVNEFLKSFIAKDFTVGNIDQLLDLQAKMETALTQNESVDLALVLASAHELLEAENIKDDLDEYIKIYGGTSVSTEHTAEVLVKGIQIETLNSEASRLIEDVTAYSRNDGKFTNPIGVARAMVGLRRSISRGNLEALIQDKDRLQSLLEGDQNYNIANQKRRLANATSRKNAETLALEQAQSYSDYLISFITENISSDLIDEALEYQENLDAAVGAGDGEIVTPLNTSFRFFLVSNNLLPEYVIYAASHDDVEAETDLKQSDNGIVVNAANKVLLEGNSGDILILQNNMGSAPNLGVNLLGNLVFDDNRAAYCWMHEPVEETTSTLMAEQKIFAFGVADLVDLGLCDNPKDVDLIFIQRGAFLRLSARQANATIKAFEEEKLKPLVIITEADILAFQSNQGESAESLEAAINAEERSGYGIVSLANGTGNICLSVEANELALTNLIETHTDALTFYFNDNIEVTSVPLERAFVMAQRNLCSGIYTNANGLKALLGGLKRERIEYSLVPLWIADDEYELEVASVNDNREARLARLVERRQKTIAAKDLARKVAETDEKLRLVRQASLREKNQDIMAGEMKELSDMTSEFISNKVDRLDLTGISGFSKLFPRFATIIQGQAGSQWVVTSEKSILVDFGTAIWQGRRISAILSEVRYDSQNAILGKYEQECAVIGYLIDDEFDLLRDAIDSPCENRSTVDKWRISHEFVSGWFAE